MPIRSKAQWRFLFATDKPFTRRWAHETPGGVGQRFRKLRSKISTKAQSDEIDRAAQAGAGSAPPSTGTPGKRSRSEVARLASLARWGKYKAKGKAKGGKGKAKAAKPTPEEKEAQKRQEAQANRTKLLGANAAAMDALAMGQQPDPAQGQALVDAGLADKLEDGSVVLNSAGKQSYNAASSGNAGAVQEIALRAKDAKAKAAKPAEEKPKAGGGGGGSAKPTPEDKAKEKQEARAKTASDTAARVGLEADDLAALTQGRDAGGADNQRMRDIGLLDANGDTTDQGRRALVALERGDVGSFRAALQDARKQLERDAQTRQRAIEKMIRDAERDRPQKQPITRRTKEQRNGITITTRETKRMEDEIKQSAQDRAMFANMGGGRGSGGGGGGASAKPSGGVGGLWKVDPKTGKRSGELGLAKGAPPSAGDSKPGAHKPGDKVRVNMMANGRMYTDATVIRRTPNGIIVRNEGVRPGSNADQPMLARTERVVPRPASTSMKPPVQAADRKQVTQDRAKAKAAFAQYSATDKEASRRTREANIARATADRVQSTQPELAKQLRLSANDNSDRARAITSHPDNIQHLRDIEAAGFRINGTGRGITPLRGSTKPPTAKKDTAMDALKYSRRHSASDEAHLGRAVGHVKGALNALMDAGAADEEQPVIEVKALDLMTQCEMVCDAIMDVINDEDAPPMMHEDEECEITVYADFAVLDTDDGSFKIDYTIEDGDVVLADPSEWARVEWDVSEIDGADSYEDAEDDDEKEAPRVVIGDAVKMLDDGRIGAYAVRFGDADNPDLSHMRDYFTKSTDFWLDAWKQRPMLYHHAQDPTTADNPIIGNWTKAIKDDVGIWLEGQLDKAHKYYAAINQMVQQGALKLSSDSAPHLVKRNRHGDVNEVTRWPLMAASLTPTPAEPRLLPVSALKAIYAVEFPPAYIEDSPETPALESADALKSAARERLLELIEIELMEVA